MHRRTSTLHLDVSAAKPGTEKQPGGERKLIAARDNKVVSGGGGRGGGWREQTGGGRDRDNERGRRLDRGRDLGRRGSPRHTGAEAGTGGTTSAALREEIDPRKSNIQVHKDPVCLR